jgi:hypothetical protein
VRLKSNGAMELRVCGQLGVDARTPEEIKRELGLG